MRLNLPTLQELPSVHAALAWLFAESESGDVDMLATARTSGAILSDDGPHWKADGEIVTRLAEVGLARLPSDPDLLGQILHGMGELAARFPCTDFVQIVRSCPAGATDANAAAAAP